MSIAFERCSENSIQRSGFIHGMPSFLGAFHGDRRFPPVERREDHSSSSSSSIGRNSDASDGENSGDDFDESEIQSSFKGPLDTMDVLEEVLPIKRGMSKFYNGKSKSFTSLANASSASSIKDFAKPENPYTRKRKNLLARSNLWDDKNLACGSKDKGSCISRKTAVTNESKLALGYTVYCSKSNNEREESQLMSSSPSSCLPPLHRAKTSLGNRSCSSPPQRNSCWRSFSLSDLQSAAAGNCND